MHWLYRRDSTDLACGVDNVAVIRDALVHNALRKCRLDGGVVGVNEVVLDDGQGTS